MQKSLELNSVKEVRLRNVLSTAAIMKPIATCLGLMFFQMATGIDIVLFFNYSIFKESGSEISPNLCSIAVGTLQMVALLMSSFVIDRLGRRPLLLISEILIVISLGALGLFFYLSKYDEGIRTTLGWLPLGSLLLYAVGYSLGMGPVAAVYLEIIPTCVAGSFHLNKTFKDSKVEISFQFPWNDQISLRHCYRYRRMHQLGHGLCSRSILRDCERAGGNGMVILDLQHRILYWDFLHLLLRPGNKGENFRGDTGKL